MIMKTLVNQQQGILNPLAAAFRYLLVIIGSVPLLLKMLGEGQFAAIVAYFQSADGTALVAAIGALITLGIGLYRTFKYGDKLVEIAADSANRNVTFKS
jgi:hypothetical protein